MNNDIGSWIVFLVIGGIVGWIAGILMKGRGFGIAGDVAVGVIGGLFGGWLFSVLGISTYTSFGAFVTALVGAVALIALTRFFKLAA